MHRAVRSDTSPLAVADHLDARDADGLVFFDSGSSPGAGRWSIVTCAPAAVLVGKGGEFLERDSGRAIDDPLTWLLERETSQAALDADVDLPFVGGLAGVLGFEFGHQLDDIHATPAPRRTWDVWVGDYPAAAVFDHGDESWQIIGEAGECFEQLIGAIEYGRLSEAELAKGSSVASTVSREAYVERVRAAIDAIHAGDIFEINYSERFEAPWADRPFDLYRRLRATSSAGFGGYVNTGTVQVLSASPEQFISVRGGHVLTRPIKGTRARGATAEEDARLARELLESEKDRAENVMIVDLMRNDLTRVCRLGTVEATALCELETFDGVHHLVSTVEGDLEPSMSPLSALLSAFPAGSISGAPKLRSIELITELEETPRGPYTGSLFYASRHGRLDSSVLIRTATLHDGVARYGAGGAVVAQSDPEAEYEEALVKAAPFFEAVDR